MLTFFSLLPLAVIPMVAPLTAPTDDLTQATQVEIAKVPLPELSAQQWKTLRQQQGADRKPLRLDVRLSIDHGQVDDATVRQSTGYPDIDTAVVNWIEANWKIAPWFVGGDDYVVSFEVNPAVRQIVFRNS
jgi:outer membrane biosynthesis protein TonB